MIFQAFITTETAKLSRREVKYAYAKFLYENNLERSFSLEELEKEIKKFRWEAGKQERERDHQEYLKLVEMNQVSSWS